MPVVSFTGHRPDKLNYEYEYKGPCTNHILKRLEVVLDRYKPTIAYNGLAVGFDQISAIKCVKMHIPFIAVIPQKGQDARWGFNALHWYNELLIRAQNIYVYDIAKYVSYKEYKELPVTPYDVKYYHGRNEFMVDKLTSPGDVLISCHNGSPGGTANCVEYANKRSKHIINIDPSFK